MKNTKIETRLEVKNEVDSEVAELYLYGTIREAYWWDDEEDCISAKRVRSSLNELSGKNINVHINSGGGDVFESISINNLLKNHDGEINVFIDGLAGSGASIIAMAGKKVYMPGNTMMMIHKAWTYAAGNSDELRKIADDLDKIDSAADASYKDRFVGTDEELIQLISDESWLTAEECLAFGLCDEILSEKKEEGQKETIENNVKENLFNKYKKDIVSEQIEKVSLFNKIKTGGNK